jgi:putative transposase
MVHYRRYQIPGGTYFFTVVLQNRQSDWLIKYIAQLKAAFRHVNNLHPFKTQAIVVLPDHLHAIWELPENDSNYSLRWRCIKIAFAKNLKQSGIDISKNKFGENVLWQRRFWEHTIRNEKDYERHVDYIHYNPVKHGLVENVNDWPYSTFHRYVREGLLPKNWSYANEDMSVE